jgi:hypothetical protein
MCPNFSHMALAELFFASGTFAPSPMDCMPE